MKEFVFRKKFFLNFSYKIYIINYPKFRVRFEILISLERPSPNFATT